MVSQPNVARAPRHRQVVYFNGSACLAPCIEPPQVTKWRLATNAAARCMEHVCLELAKVPVRANVQMQMQSLKNAKQRLETELRECKANAQLQRYAALQTDMQEADRVIQALRQALEEQGCTSKQIDAAIDSKVLRGERLVGASREMLQRELRSLRAQKVTGGGIITSKTYQTANLELCRAPKAGHPAKVSAYSELIAIIQSSRDKLMLAAADVEWKVPQPPETAEVACQSEGLEATPAEQLSRELYKIKELVCKLRGTTLDVDHPQLPIDQHAVPAPNPGTSVVEEAIASPVKIAAAADHDSEALVKALKAENECLSTAMEKGHSELEVVRACLKEKQAVIDKLQQQLIQGLEDLKNAQVNTAREAMKIMIDNHDHQLTIIKDVSGAITDCRVMVEDQSGRMDKLAHEQARHAETGQRVLGELQEQIAGQRDQSARLAQDNRNMIQKLTAQTALIGHVQRLDRDVVENIGDKVAKNLSGKALARKLTDRLGASSSNGHNGTGNFRSPQASSGSMPAGLWAHAVDGSIASTVTEEAEMPDIVAQQTWRTATMRPPTVKPDLITPAARNVTGLGLPQRTHTMSGNADLSAWESLEEIQMQQAMATAAKSLCPGVPSGTSQKFHQVAKWMGTLDTEGGMCGELDDAATDDLLQESRTIRCELQVLLNTAFEQVAET